LQVSSIRFYNKIVVEEWVINLLCGVQSSLNVE
jgi:hypothetical protein